jgi:hypothetical protein
LYKTQKVFVISQKKERNGLAVERDPIVWYCQIEKEIEK